MTKNTKDYSSIRVSEVPQKSRKGVRFKNKGFMVNLFRLAFLTKDTSSVLYEKIREEIITELLKGNHVNLFGLVILEPISRMHNTGFGSEKNLKLIRRIKARIPSSFRTEWSKKFIEDKDDV